MNFMLNGKELPFKGKGHLKEGEYLWSSSKSRAVLVVRL